MEKIYFQNQFDYRKAVTWTPAYVPPLPQLKNKHLPLFISNIDNALREKCSKGKLILPERRTMENHNIGVYSDYGGEHDNSHYLSYSILICGYNHSYGFIEEMKKFRKDYNLADREIAFKKLKNGPIQRAISRYLYLADYFVVGCLFTLVVSKKIKSLFQNEFQKKLKREQLPEELKCGNWKQDVTEKLLRISHLIAYWIAILSKANQGIFWMTDNDAIAPNHSKHKMLMQIVARILPLYTHNQFSKFGGALPLKGEDPYKDFLSIADLAAGAIEKWFSVEKNQTIKTTEINNGVADVYRWLSHDGIGLKKFTYLLDLDDENKLILGDVNFQQPAPPE